MPWKRRIRCLKNLGYGKEQITSVRHQPGPQAGGGRGLWCQDSDEDRECAPRGLLRRYHLNPPRTSTTGTSISASGGGIPCFVEASVILGGLEELNRRAKEKGILVAPSCTMRFHTALKDVKRIVGGGRYGKVTNFTYHSGYYLLDWHPWEKVSDYYVSRKETVRR